VFKAFHKVLSNYGVLRGKVRDTFRVSPNTIAYISNLISEMTKAAGIKVTQGGGVQKQMEMAQEFETALDDYLQLNAWNSSIELDMKTVRGTRKRPVYDYLFAFLSVLLQHNQKPRYDTLKSRIASKEGEVAEILLKGFESKEEEGSQRTGKVLLRTGLSFLETDSTSCVSCCKGKTLGSLTPKI